MSGHILIKDKETGEEITGPKEMLLWKHGKNCWAGIKQCHVKQEFITWLSVMAEQVLIQQEKLYIKH